MTLWQHLIGSTGCKMIRLVANQPTLPSSVCHLLWRDLEDTTGDNACFIFLWQDQEYQQGRFFTRVSTSTPPSHPANEYQRYFSRSCCRDSQVCVSNKDHATNAKGNYLQMTQMHISYPEKLQAKTWGTKAQDRNLLLSNLAAPGTSTS